jgi:Flp pilus assembly protein TadG
MLALMIALCALPALADVAADVEAGQALTHDQLVEKAKAETGTFVVYGNTSRITTAAAGTDKNASASPESNRVAVCIVK